MESRKDPLDLGQDHPHVFTCHNNILETYKCEHCLFETKLKVSLTRHVNRNHKNLPNRFRNVLRQCGSCDFQTFSMLVLLKHCSTDCAKILTNSANVVWYQCEYRATRRQDDLKLNETAESANVVWYHCDECEYKSKWKNNLKQHIENRHSDEWYRCDKCRFQTKWKFNLKKHIASFHSDPANAVWYHCDKCKHKTKCKSNLNKHILSFHADSGKILWCCDECEYTTNVKNELKLHQASFHVE